MLSFIFLNELIDKFGEIIIEKNLFGAIFYQGEIKIVKINMLGNMLIELFCKFIKSDLYYGVMCYMGI